MKKRNGLAIEMRHEKIVKLINQNGKVSVKELCDIFNVSVVTIRNDLIQLESNNLIIRTHGGAIPAKAIDNGDGHVLPFDIREEHHFDVKQRIGKAAADLIHDGEVIFIDGGTTASEMRHYLVDKKDITIITPSIVVTYWLAVTSNLKIYVLNGFFKRDSYSTIGIPSMDFMSQWNLSKAFFGASGYTTNEGLSDLDIGYVEQKKIIAQKAHTIIGLIDSSKWGILSLGSFVPSENIDILITDMDTPQSEIQKAEELGIQVKSV